MTAWPEEGCELCVSGQVVREYIAVCTRPLEVNGLGLSMAQALDNVDGLLGRLRLLEETREVAARLLSLLRGDDSIGKQVHDANIVATMLAHGISQLLTDNVRHFARFQAIRLRDLAEVSA